MICAELLCNNPIICYETELFFLPDVIAKEIALYLRYQCHNKCGLNLRYCDYTCFHKHNHIHRFVCCPLEPRYRAFSKELEQAMKNQRVMSESSRDYFLQCSVFVLVTRYMDTTNKDCPSLVQQWRIEPIFRRKNEKSKLLTTNVTKDALTKVLWLESGRNQEGGFTVSAYDDLRGKSSENIVFAVDVYKGYTPGHFQGYQWFSSVPDFPFYVRVDLL